MDRTPEMVPYPRISFPGIFTNRGASSSTFAVACRRGLKTPEDQHYTRPMKSLQSLRDLDTAIERLRQADGSQGQDAEYLISALAEGVLLDAPLNHADVRVAGLLRITAIDHHVVYESEHRRNTIELIKERLKETDSTILTKYDLSPGNQADEDCRRMARVAEDAMTGLTSALQSYQGIATLKDFRYKILKAINDDRAKAVIRPFFQLDGDPSDKLQRCLGAAVSYLDANAGGAGAYLDDALALIRGILEATSSAPTVVSKLVSFVLEQLYADLQDHYDANPYSKPAQISLDSALRRHPLHVPDLEISIPVALINSGEGVAIDLEIEIIDAIGIQPIGSPLRLSNVIPGQMIVEFHALTDPTTMEGMDAAPCEFRLSWMNSDGSEESKNITTDLQFQDPNVDWDSLHYTNPYSLEAVSKEEDLIGRGGMLSQITRVLTTASVGSLYIHGQKRVGKTSLALVALDMLERTHQATCIYLEIGEINNPDPARAIDNLTERLISELNDRLTFPVDIPLPEHDGSLAPLVKVLRKLAAEHKPIILAIDEFDRLPAPLYRRTAEADAFFTALRSIATIRGVGVILIGGERMKLIINGPGVELNKFKAFQVEYLDRSTNWTEFEELIRKPTDQYLEFTDSACDRVYEATAGNPFYTKQLCDKVLELATQRRDAYVDGREIDVAVKQLVGTIDSTSFSHYWEDHLLEHDHKRDEVTLNRRRCLLALGLTWASGEPVTSNAVVEEGLQLGLDFSSTHRELQQFKDRGIIVDTTGVWTPRVSLFRRWLVEQGQQQIIISAAELESAEHVIAQRTSLRVSIGEADDLANRFGTFKGKAISGERILEYLQQFGELRDQRLIFKFLCSLTFISQADEYELLRGAYDRLQQRLKDRHEQWKRDQLLLTHTGRIEKSGVAMTRAFIRANTPNLGLKSIHDPDELDTSTQHGITDIVLVDDFIGSGDSLTHALEELQEHIPSSACLHVLVLAGMCDGVDRVATTVQELFGSQSSVECMIEIPNDPGPFALGTGVYGEEEEARDALAIVRRFGLKLEPRIPLGYGDCCAPVVFSSSIPNNAPAILWSASSGNFKFTPLFPRNS